MTRTVVGLFRDPSEARAAVHDLENSGIARDKISVVSRGEDGDVKDPTHEPNPATAKGAAIGGVAGAVLGIAALAIPGIGPIVAAGPLAAALTGAGVGAATGGMLGALHDMGMSDEEAQHWAEGLRRGGTLVAVHGGEELTDKAQSVLDRHGALDVDAHRGEEGWSVEDAHAEAPNFGDEGGSSQWGRSVLSSDAKRLRSRVYDRLSPDKRGS